VSFDGGVTIPASASPHVVGNWAVDAAVDPEEMLVAALSSCHMLSFLHVARLAGFAVAAYQDHAEGRMEEIAPGRQAVTRSCCIRGSSGRAQFQTRSGWSICTMKPMRSASSQILSRRE
jgi:organic hydroperoxide reductase OsmC/OhrA